MTERTFNINLLRITALVIVAVGAIGSLYFMFNASRNQKSILLIALFTAWVLSPFIGFFLTMKISKQWTTVALTSLYWLMIILTIGSLIAYGGAFNTPQTKNAFRFLVVPFLLWLILIIAFLITRRSSSKNNTNSLNPKH